MLVGKLVEIDQQTDSDDLKAIPARKLLPCRFSLHALNHRFL